MHRQFQRDLQRPSAGKEKSLAWLFSSGLKGETESLIIAAQNQALSVGYHQRNMKQPTDSTCRTCCKAEEHMHHIVQGCTILMHLNTLTDRISWLVTSTERYVKRCCGHVPERVINVNVTPIMWDVPAVTDRTILANRPDIVLHDKKEKTCLPIDIALPDASNPNTKELKN